MSHLTAPPSIQIVLKNLYAFISGDEIFEFFAGYGPVLDIKHPKGMPYAFVELADRDMGQRAIIELNNRRLSHYCVQLEEARESRDRYEAYCRRMDERSRHASSNATTDDAASIHSSIGKYHKRDPLNCHSRDSPRRKRTRGESMSSDGHDGDLGTAQVAVGWLSKQAAMLNSRDSHFIDCLLRVSAVASVSDSSNGDESNMMVEFISAHKSQLALHSSFFHQLFTDPAEQERAEEKKAAGKPHYYDLPNGISAKQVGHLLQFIYTGQFTDDDFAGNETMLPSLLNLAERFGVDSLKDYVMRRLSSSHGINENNVLEMAKLAHAKGQHSLLDECARVLGEHKGVVLKSEGWRELKETNPTLTTELLEAIAGD